MTDQQLTDKTGAVVTVEHDDTRRAYAVSFANGEVAGRTFHTPSSADEWIFFHTEVDDEYGGRGLGGILVGQAMADVARRGRTVVPLCPFVKGWLEKNGDEFAAAGGSVRAPRPGDLDTVRAAQKGA
jgi:predicted GNAT family acetyltransferase